MKQATVKNIKIGGGAPISIQSMTNLSVLDIDATLEQIKALECAGCDIVRIALPNSQSVDAFKVVRTKTDIPLVADIHFDYRLAIGGIEAGADKIRINPGNIPQEHLDKVIHCAKAHNIAIRLGVNGGSVNKAYLDKFNGDKKLALIESLRDYTNYFADRNFDNLVLSVKSSDIRQTVELNRAIATLGYPLHLGVTEAGLLRQGLVKNAIGIGSLLLDGIGDTIRVSLTSNPVDEVYAAKDILVSLGLKSGVQFVSCPKCGRCSIDLETIATQVYDYVKTLNKNIKVAVMGCEVNGPGECKDADIGIAGANGGYILFKHGQVYKRIAGENVLQQFIEEVNKL
ncbi:MAG: flavodoxin-dependent (E)-4-hydroxy-3-methylbut-2-enyl-diphosphate synthase [Clostridia bacterium]|nr:flavodoxin-dependent (E)-4-hydroxy-3-methylbut-2-enyl-diphosphate synthase [Clostridia bacterium]MBQ3042302.1 flavodoxin-dependent (E)-4-hydroxy-3-methylbut-2-enyl-diphosphate synthase [Clostridia bacterium]